MRVAVVTGAARGIGAATVRRLVGEGWGVVAIDVCADDPAIDYPMARATSSRALRQADGSVTTVVADVRDLVGLQHAVDIAVETYGGVDAAFAVAGVIAGGESAWTTSIDAERTVIDVDLVGVPNLARVAVPALLRGRGRGPAASSRSRRARRRKDCRGSRPTARPRPASWFRSRGLAADLRGTGITANAVSPGSTETAMLTESARSTTCPASRSSPHNSRSSG